MTVQQSAVGEQPVPKITKIAILIWMVFVVFAYHILFGSQEFWSLMNRLGVDNILFSISGWLQLFLSADYLS
jgi:hypothetical protein